MPRGMKPDGMRIAQARTALPGKVTQAEFAQRLGIHWVTMSNIENGKANVSLELLERIATETGTTREHLLGLEAEDEEAAAPMVDHIYMLDALIAALEDVRAKAAA